MKNPLLCTFAAFVLFVSVAVAQTPSSQGTQRSSPTMSQPGGSGQSGYPSQQPGTMGQTDQNAPGQNQPQQKSEKKIKGCVQSQGGQYVLETKKGKAVALTGQDVSAHVGHEVAVKGTWETGGAGSSSSAAAGGSEKLFNVANVEMISDSCSKGKSSSNSGTGNSGNMGTAPSGNSTGPSNSGSTTPPQ